MRFKRTEVCQTCAKLKNVCQTCIFDLQYGALCRPSHAAGGVSGGAKADDRTTLALRTIGGRRARARLRTGLPVQVRDQILKTGGNVARSAINKEYFTQNAEAQVRWCATSSSCVAGLS